MSKDEPKFKMLFKCPFGSKITTQDPDGNLKNKPEINVGILDSKIPD